MWYLGPGAMPVPATSKKVPAGVTAFCYVGETEWTPIGRERSQGEGGRLQ